MESNRVGNISHWHSREGGGHLNRSLNGVRGSRAGSWRESIRDGSNNGAKALKQRMFDVSED